MIVGIYTNRNYENSVLAEVPHNADTLTLFKDNHFESPYWGKGTYKLSYGFDGTNIGLNAGTSGFHTNIMRPWLQRPALIIDEGLEYHYEKSD